ncbi:solute carrier organic anion transporter family member 4A1-like [Patiria miniata]|uniref:Solute carrier organic anion transporter family member n=1 Tax=Patiria miniata TaxID=46514 RepID=A0A913ZJD6_PATMI|nr:solute carrier organic anion transporter family member 4A1-like [Patiria miniata]
MNNSTGAMDDQNDRNEISNQAEVEMRNPNKRTPSISSKEEDANEDVECVPYGWLSIRPKWLQFLNNPKGYLVFLCWFVFVQGMAVNGFISVIISTLERRFVLPSVQSGSISSCYDFSVMIIIIFVTYLGESSHKPKWLGTGAFIFVLGSLVFMLPHFITPEYDVTPSEVDTCDPTRPTANTCLEGDSSLSNYFWMFVAAQALHGIGASPLFTLGVTYLDENVRPASLSIYIGIFQAVSTLGPAVGYLVGGLFLGIWTDFPKEPPGGIADDHPLWVGAWWLGSVMPACLGILMVLPLLGFPRYLKDHKKVAALRVVENQKGTDFKSRSETEGVAGGIKDFPVAVWTLVKNAPFMFICLGLITESMILSSISAFGPKLLESQFSVSSGSSAIIAGMVVIPSGLIGALIGGFLVKKFNLMFRGMILLCIATLSVSLVLMAGFFFNCPSLRFAGVNTYYNNTSLDYKGVFDLASQCNSNCSCDTSYNPVCGDNNIMYYSSCHAGCTEKLDKNADGYQTFSGCGCVSANETDARNGAVAGECSIDCGNLWGFIVVVFAMALFAFVAVVPTVTATIRCVSHTQRAFALGVQSLLYRALGTVPGPIIFGSIIDQSCILWETSCDGARQCWLYNNGEMSLNVFILLASLKLGSCIFYILCYMTYRAPSSAEEGKDSDVKMASDGKAEGAPVGTLSTDF